MGISQSVVREEDLITTIEELSDCVSGLEITGAEIHDDGLHFYLANGEVLFVVGALAVCLLKPEDRFLQ